MIIALNAIRISHKLFRFLANLEKRSYFDQLTESLENVPEKNHLEKINRILQRLWDFLFHVTVGKFSSNLTFYTAVLPLSCLNSGNFCNFK